MMDHLRPDALVDAIDLSASLTEAELAGRTCFRCGDDFSDKRRLQASSEPLIECADVETCGRRVSQLRLLGIIGQPAGIGTDAPIGSQGVVGAPMGASMDAVSSL